MKWNPSATVLLRGFAFCGAWVVVANVLALWNYSQTGEVGGVRYVAALVVAMICGFSAVWNWGRQGAGKGEHWPVASELAADMPTVRTLADGICVQPSPEGFEEWLETQPRALQAAASSCPPGTYLNDGDVGMILGYEQDDAGKVWVTLCIPSLEERRLHINQLQAVDVDEAEE